MQAVLAVLRGNARWAGKVCVNFFGESYSA
jgi:hypothetical protein